MPGMTNFVELSQLNDFSVIAHLEGTLFAHELPFGAANK
jgi:hypothetical protein